MCNNFPCIDLLNSEGPILRAIKTDNGFLIIDEFNKEIAILNKNDIYQFTRGNLEFVDSKQNVFNYSKFPGSMKPDLKKLDEFIGIDTSMHIY